MGEYEGNGFKFIGRLRPRFYKMNIDLRKDILEASLEIEDLLSKLLITLLRIKKSDDKSKIKTLGHTGSPLSFRTKVDLLYDIDIFNKTQYTHFILFMEIRNQFIHNLDADSFDVVMPRVNKPSMLSTFLTEEETAKFPTDKLIS